MGHERMRGRVRASALMIEKAVNTNVIGGRMQIEWRSSEKPIPPGQKNTPQWWLRRYLLVACLLFFVGSQLAS